MRYIVFIAVIVIALAYFVTNLIGFVFLSFLALHTYNFFSWANFIIGLIMILGYIGIYNILKSLKKI